MRLYAPPSYWETPKEKIDRITGGCGPGGFGDWLVPDTIYGLSVFQSCRIHDYMYHIGKSLTDKEEADRVFLNNMIRQIRDGTKWKWLMFFRRQRAKTYYLFVKEFGGPAFWDGKNRPTEFRNIGAEQEIAV